MYRALLFTERESLLVKTRLRESLDVAVSVKLVSGVRVCGRVCERESLNENSLIYVVLNPTI